jgi:hypothetical protein
LPTKNIPGAAVAALEAAGHDVVWVRFASPGASDDDVLVAAMTEGRILLTFDKDFGELAGRADLPADCGVILLRIPPPRSTPAARRLVMRIGSRTDWNGHFSVIEPGRVRMRRLR